MRKHYTLEELNKEVPPPDGMTWRVGLRGIGEKVALAHLTVGEIRIAAAGDIGEAWTLPFDGTVISGRSLSGDLLTAARAVVDYFSQQKGQDK